MTNVLQIQRKQISTGTAIFVEITELGILSEFRGGLIKRGRASVKNRKKAGRILHYRHPA
jgi:hypothetical protein